MRATITIPIETLSLIIAKAREVEGDIDDDDGEAEIGDDEGEAVQDESELLAADEDDEAAEDLEDDELMEFFGSFSRAELVELLALMWVGGGDHDEEDWDEAVSRARALSDQDVLTHLLDADELSDLIEDGLVALGYAVTIEDGAPA